MATAAAALPTAVKGTGKLTTEGARGTISAAAAGTAEAIEGSSEGARTPAEGCGFKLPEGGCPAMGPGHGRSGNRSGASKLGSAEPSWAARTSGNEVPGAVVDSGWEAPTMGPVESTVAAAGPRRGPKAWSMPRAAQARASSGRCKHPRSSTDEEVDELANTSDSWQPEAAEEWLPGVVVPPGQTSARARAASSAALATPNAELPARAAARAIAAIAKAALTAAGPGWPEAWARSLPSEKSAMMRRREGAEGLRTVRKDECG
jgi:hypothetical protein